MTTCEDLKAINARREEALKGPRDPSKGDLPYYGYFDVNVFECPPFVMFTNNDSPGAANILNRGAFEKMSTRLWCRLARTATGILDIGANVGIYSLCAAALRPDLTIHAFEPNPYAFARLRMHKEVNKFSNIAEYRQAVGNTNAIIPITWVVKPGGNISSGGGLGERYGITEKFLAELMALDQTELHTTIGTRPLIKMDVEGAELLALRGMTKIIGLKPDLILETFDEAICKKINAIFQNSGYSVYGITESGERLEPRPHLIPSSQTSGDFNQLITFRSRAEIDQLIAQSRREGGADISTEQNKRVAKEFIEAMFKRDPDRVAATLSEDWEYTIGGKHARFVGVRTKQQWCNYLRNPSPFTEDLKLTIHDMIAEGESVAVEMESHGVIAATGKVYNNTYTFIFTVRDGKIVKAREYMDTHHVVDVLPLPPK